MANFDDLVNSWYEEYNKLMRQGKYIEAANLVLLHSYDGETYTLPNLRNIHRGIENLPIAQELRQEILEGRSIVVSLEGDKYRVTVGKFAPDLIMSVDELHELMEFCEYVRRKMMKEKKGEEGEEGEPSWDVTKTEDGTVIMDQSGFPLEEKSWEDRIATRILYPESSGEQAAEGTGSEGRAEEGTGKEEEDDNLHKS